MKPPLDVPPVGSWELHPGQDEASLTGTRAVGAANHGPIRSTRLSYLLAAVRRRNRRVRRMALAPQ